MIRQALLVLSIIVFLSSLVAAETTIVFNKTYSEGGSVEILDEEYILGVSDSNTTSVQLSKGNESFILRLKKCETIQYHRICHDAKLSDTSARLVLYDLRPIIEHTVDVNRTKNLMVGDEVKVVVWMNNTGMNDAEDVYMSSSIPKNMSLRNVRYCSHNETHILFSGKITADQGLECVYILRMEDVTDAKITSTLFYESYGDLNTSTIESKNAIETHMPFTINITHTDLSLISPGKPFVMDVSLYNPSEENLTLGTFTIEFDKNVEAQSVSSPKASIRGDHIRFTRQLLEFNETVDFTTQFMVPKNNVSGVLEFTISYNFSEGGPTRTFQRFVPYATGGTNLQVWMDPPQATFESGAKGNVTLYVRNTNPFLSLKGYDVEISSDLMRAPVLRQIPYLSSRILAEIEFTAPKTDVEKSIPLSVSLIAKTSENEVISTVKEFTIRIIPTASIEITKEFSESNGKRTIIVSAKNNHPLAIELELREEASEGVFMSGNTSRTLHVEAGTTQKAYSFSYVVDDNITGPLEFTTTYEYTYNGALVSGTHPVLVDAQFAPIQKNSSLNSSVQNSLNTTGASTNVSMENQSIQVPNQTPDYSSAQTNGSIPLNTILIAAAVFVFIAGLVVLFILRKPKKIKKSDKEKQPLQNVDTHNSIQLEHQRLLAEKQAIHKQKLELTTDFKRITAKINHVQNYLQQYSKVMPTEYEKLELQRKHIKDIEQAVEKKRQNILEKEKALQLEEKNIAEYSARLGFIEKDIDAKEEKLHNDKQTLQNDIMKLKEEQNKLKTIEQDMSQNEANLKQQLDDLKLRQVKHYRNRLSELTVKKSQLFKGEKDLAEEERKIHVEFEKVKNDLQISEDDLAYAEKVYKEAVNAMQVKPDEKKK